MNYWHTIPEDFRHYLSYDYNTTSGADYLLREIQKNYDAITGMVHIHHVLHDRIEAHANLPHGRGRSLIMQEMFQNNPYMDIPKPNRKVKFARRQHKKNKKQGPVTAKHTDENRKPAIVNADSVEELFEFVSYVNAFKKIKQQRKHLSPHGEYIVNNAVRITHALIEANKALTALQQEHADLREAYADAQKNMDTMIRAHNSLSDDYELLEKSKENLVQEFDKVCEEYSALKAKLNQLIKGVVA